MSLKGTLHDMSLVDLIQVFEVTEKSGTLLLRSNLQRGVIFSRDGRLIDAAIVDGPTREIVTHAEEAVIALLQWDDATFVFHTDSTVDQRPVRIFHDNQWLILEGIRRRPDPLAALPHQPITPTTSFVVLTLPSDATSSMLLNLNQWQVLSELRSGRDMSALCESLDLDFSDAARIVAELVAIKLIEPIPSRPPTSRPVPLQPALPRTSSILLDEFDVISKSAMTRPTVPSRPLLNAVKRRILNL